MNDVDDYNLPERILGTHPDEFYGAMGRIVCICAVLEDRVIALRHALERVEQGRFTNQPISRQIAVARSFLVNVAEPGREVIASYLDRVGDAFKTRNDLVHGSFPAQASGEIWGHRMTRDRAVLDGTADTVEITLTDLRIFIGHLSELVIEFNAAMPYTAYDPTEIVDGRSARA